MKWLAEVEVRSAHCNSELSETHLGIKRMQQHPVSLHCLPSMAYLARSTSEIMFILAPQGKFEALSSGNEVVS